MAEWIVTQRGWPHVMRPTLHCPLPHKQTFTLSSQNIAVKVKSNFYIRIWKEKYDPDQAKDKKKKRWLGES
jgi:hypothetical protein